ncbi:MAG: hypothetical protein V5804_09885 [Mucilaginibacter sp.]|uniref:hypothetical protein n=1 Tax=Mucilaginibacter sp. TaxID=1882438 RepID=UPI0034E40B2D
MPVKEAWQFQNKPCWEKILRCHHQMGLFLPVLLLFQVENSKSGYKFLLERDL